jgi:CRISPR/Cas system CSM-associated protein Csm3 (group 7 of RAMP superfamily)
MGEGRLSGVLHITLTARTPLLIGGYERANAAGDMEPDVPRRAAVPGSPGPGTPMVPGSGLLGAVRSVHEALAGGCLRVLDTDWAAVHRDPASTAETRDLQLAVVLADDGHGRPTTVALCDQVIWIDQELLPRSGHRLPRTGDRLRLPAGAAVRSGDRMVLRPPEADRDDVGLVGEMSAVLDDSWVLLVTDTKARTPGKPAYFVAGRLGRDSLRCRVPDDADGDVWLNYLAVVGGADDLRPANLPGRAEPEWGSCPPEFADVFWPLAPDGTPAGPAIAERLRARRYLHRGQPVWVRLEGRTVTEIRLSRLWRYRGDHPVGQRAGLAVPCDDPERLCWSCRVFGSADASGRREDDIARQSSYRGHVRVDDLLATAPFQPVPWHLASLAAPKASAGQFYLDNSAVPQRKRLAVKDTKPAARWGSSADDGRERPIRGRKFYWRTKDPDKGEHPRGAHRHQADTQSRRVVLVPAGTVFTGRVCFDNLSAEDYGSLLAALDPRLLSRAGLDGWGDTVTSVGGGKPFGFGAVSIEVQAGRPETAASRYLGQDGENVPDVTEAVTAFRAAVPSKVSATWAALRNVLTFGFIQDDLVWYPPGINGAKGDAEFDRSFEFFARTTGLELKDKVRDLVVLPPAAAPAGSQVLDSTAGERPTSRGDGQHGRGGRASRRPNGRRS